MEKLIAPHHTVADWDFTLGSLYHSLSTLQFVSAPTSLRFNATGSTARRITVLCRIATTLCIPQGEVRTWFWNGYYVQHPLVFRSQSPLGSAVLDNTYRIMLGSDYWKLIRREDSTEMAFPPQPASHTWLVWEHWRVKFWNGLDPDPLDHLCVEVYKEVAGAWVQQGARVYDPANKWKDSAINRSGFHCIVALDKNEYFDDTEIWGVA